MTEEPLRQMTLSEHLRELQLRLFRSMVIWFVVFLICLYFQDGLMGFVLRPHNKAMELLKADNIKVDTRLMSMTYIRPFLTYLKLSLIASLFFASPFIAYQLWKFVSAGLYRSEKKAILIYAPMSYFLFLSGCALGYFVILPEGLYYLAKYGNPEYVESRFSLTEYFDLVMFFTIIMGVVFQLPLVMAFFSKVGIISPKTYIEWWRFAVVLMFVIAAFVTPSPDIPSQLAVALPLCLLYGLGILLSKIVYPKVKQ